jgi:hypothetical protein
MEVILSSEMPVKFYPEQHGFTSRSISPIILKIIGVRTSNPIKNVQININYSIYSYLQWFG